MIERGRKARPSLGIEVKMLYLHHLPVSLKLNIMRLNKHICDLAYCLEERLEGKTIGGDNFCLWMVRDEELFF